MKLSEHWLREWVNPSLSSHELAEKLTFSGLEVESITPVAEKFSQVVIAEILNVEKHPEADKLSLCEVSVGDETPLKIVCGATNVKKGIKVPAALVGAELGTLKISKQKLRGETSEGMLCSAKELGLTEQSEGLMILPFDAPVGKNIWEYLSLSDQIIDISITPNRGDCLSVLGLAREISALTHTTLQKPALQSVPKKIADQLPVHLHAELACPRYVGRIIRGIQSDTETPIWMKERLRRSGQRSIHPVVDVMNYVMLELGQPMHAFDLQKIHGSIQVRMAKSNEELILLDGQTVKLNEKTLVIADEKVPMAIAGVMGGLDSSVTLLTKDIFLESAYFHSSTIAQSARHYILNSESSYRFERGIDPTIQTIAIERATQLLLEIVGGTPGPIIEMKHDAALPKPTLISLATEKVEKILGMQVSDAVIKESLQRLGFHVENQKITTPSFRHDIKLDVDLIEEIARVVGYDAIPTHAGFVELVLHARSESKLSLASVKQTLCDLGFFEAITYSFVDKKIQTLFDPEMSPKELVNPITSDMNVMRTSLWPGLVQALLYNQNRQQSRVRLFETGLRFISKNNQLEQQMMVSGLVSGTALPEQWGLPKRAVDFFDLKGDLENIFSMIRDEIVFKPGLHAALHPGQTAFIYRKDQCLGVMGALHPNIAQKLNAQGKIYLFELEWDKLQSIKIPKAMELSKFPEIRRDLAIIVDHTVPAAEIQDTIVKVAGELLKEITIFDLYQGKGIPENRKSIALALILQHATRTLVDEEVAELMERILVVLKQRFTAELRG